MRKDMVEAYGADELRRWLWLICPSMFLPRAQAVGVYPCPRRIWAAAHVALAGSNGHSFFSNFQKIFDFIAASRSLLTARLDPCRGDRPWSQRVR